MGENTQQKQAMLGHLLAHFYGNYVEMVGLKAPGNSSDQFWSNQISVLLYERPKPNISMNYGF